MATAKTCHNKKKITNGNIFLCLNDSYFAKNKVVSCPFVNCIKSFNLYGRAVWCLAYSEEQQYILLNVWPEGNKTTRAAFIALVQASIIDLSWSDFVLHLGELIWLSISLFLYLLISK